MESALGKISREDLWALMVIGILDLPEGKLMELYKVYKDHKELLEKQKQVEE